MNDLDNIQTQLVKKITMKVDNQIEDFIVRAVKAYGFDSDEEITINAKKIYEAIKKRIPTKPISGPLSALHYRCPSCHCVVRLNDDRFMCCPLCGQALDWSEDELQRLRN